MSQKDQRGAIHLAETQKWLAWRKDERRASDVQYLAAQLAAAWDARLKKAA